MHDAMFHLAGGTWTWRTAPVEIRIGRVAVAIRLADEGGRVDCGRRDGEGRSGRRADGRAGRWVAATLGRVFSHTRRVWEIGLRWGEGKRRLGATG